MECRTLSCRTLLAVAVAGVSLTAVWPAVARLVAAHAPADSSAVAEASAWMQWGGPDRNFIVHSTGLADKWPDTGPPVLWSRPLGTGHSSIVVDEGRLFTMYRRGNGRAKQGPWDAAESVIALDATSGKTLWEHEYPSRREDFSFGAGPHSTPLVVGDRLFAIGTNQQLFAFDKRTGRVLWSHDFIREFNSPELLIRPTVKTGYGCSPIAFRETIICSVGGPGQSVMAFRQSDGAVVWKSGDFLTAAAAPILIEFGGRPQVVFLAGGTITGLDPATGRVLWSHPHDPGNDLNCGTPIWGSDDVLFVSSAYRAGSRAIRLRQQGDLTFADELWFTTRVRFMFLNAIRLGDYVYGTTGDFGPAFLTALNIKTGQAAWQHRGFGRASLVHADGKTIILDEDGDLALARLTPEGATILSQAKVFDTTSWTVPTLVGTTLYARDREKIVSLDLGQPGRAGEASAAGPAPRAAPGANPESSAKPLVAPTPPATFAGTWKLDATGSRVNDSAGIAGLAAAGAPPMLHITQPANGTLVVESPINEGHARIYIPGARTATPFGQGGTIAMIGQWVDRTFVGHGTAAPNSGAASAVKEVFSVSSDGKMLTIDVTYSAADGSDARTSSLKYSRIQDVGPCEKWPTPCKRF
jgi:outer membrane protein assembly factor BamB